MLGRIKNFIKDTYVHIYRYFADDTTIHGIMDDSDQPSQYNYLPPKSKPKTTAVPNHFHGMCIPCFRGGQGEHGGRSIYKMTVGLLHAQEKCPFHCKWDGQARRYICWADKDLIRTTETHLAPLITSIISNGDGRTLPEVNWNRLRTAAGTVDRHGTHNRFKDWTREAASVQMHTTMMEHRTTKNTWDYLLTHNPDLVDDTSDDCSTPGDTSESDDSDEANETEKYTKPSHGRDFGPNMPLMEDEDPNDYHAQKQAHKDYRRTRRATKKQQKRTTATARQVTHTKLGKGHLGTTATNNIQSSLGGTHSSTASSSTAGPTNNIPTENMETTNNGDWTSIDPGTIGNLTTSMNALNLGLNPNQAKDNLTKK